MKHDGLRPEHIAYLRTLKGAVDLWGAPVSLMRRFGLTKRQAWHILLAGIDSFENGEKDDTAGARPPQVQSYGTMKLLARKHNE